MSYKIALFERKKSNKIYVGKMQTNNLLIIALTDEEKEEFENGLKNIVEILKNRKDIQS